MHLLLQGDPAGNAVDKGHLEVQTHAPNGLKCAQPLDDISPGLLDNGNVGNNDH